MAKRIGEWRGLCLLAGLSIGCTQSFSGGVTTGTVDAALVALANKMDAQVAEAYSKQDPTLLTSLASQTLAPQIAHAKLPKFDEPLTSAGRYRIFYSRLKGANSQMLQLKDGPEVIVNCKAVSNEILASLPIYSSGKLTTYLANWVYVKEGSEWKLNSAGIGPYTHLGKTGKEYTAKAQEAMSKGDWLAATPPLCTALRLDKPTGNIQFEYSAQLETLRKQLLAKEEAFFPHEIKAGKQKIPLCRAVMSCEPFIPDRPHLANKPIPCIGIYSPAYDPKDGEKTRASIEQCHAELVKLFPHSCDDCEVVEYKLLPKLTTSDQEVLSARVATLIDVKTGKVIRALKGQRRDAEVR